MDWHGVGKDSLSDKFPMPCRIVYVDPGLPHAKAERSVQPKSV